ncbi:MAG: hypothetical protein Q9227_001711 [Pyrenula ochraceoflavens]
MAVRAAIALGINMRNDSTNIKDASKEVRYRVWWSLYVLEQQLLISTGRPTFIQDKICTAPLPLPYEEDRFGHSNAVTLMSTESQSGSRFPQLDSDSSRSPSSRSTSTSKQATSASYQTPHSQSRSPSNNPATELEWAKSAQPCLSLYFLHYVQLARIVRMVFDRLYAPNKLGRSWSEVQRTVDRLEHKIDHWKSTLPAVFDWGRHQRDKAFANQRLILGLYYHSVRMIITRPFLCRLDRKMPQQSATSRHFNHTTAVACVEAAMATIDMLPDKLDVVAVYKTTTWWTILQQIMQATSVLLLEMSFRAHHMPQEASNILHSTKKALRWLHQMASDDNQSALKAWRIANTLFRDAALKIGAPVDDIPDYFQAKRHALPTTTTYTTQPYHHPPTTNATTTTAMPDFTTPMPTPTTSMNDFNVFPYLMSNAGQSGGYTAFDQYVPDYTNLAGMLPAMDGQDMEMEFMTDAYHDGYGVGQQDGVQ